MATVSTATTSSTDPKDPEQMTDSTATPAAPWVVDLLDGIAGSGHDDLEQLRLIRKTLAEVETLGDRLRALQAVTIGNLRAADWTLAQIGEAVGVSAQRVSQLTTTNNEGAHRG